MKRTEYILLIKYSFKVCLRYYILIYVNKKKEKNLASSLEKLNIMTKGVKSQM